MPEYLRALIVILVLATAVFAFAHRPAFALVGAKDFKRRRNLWYALTLAAFFSHSFWIFVFIAIPLLAYAFWRETNIPALFFFVLFVLPTNTVPIPGMGLINFFFELSYLRLLELFILLPAFFILIRKRDTLSFGRAGPDMLLIAYMLLSLLLSFREGTLTNSMRYVFYLFIDVFLPYFVISRSLKNMQHFREASLSFVLAVMICALVAVFESARHWPLYQGVLGPLGLTNEYAGSFGFFIHRDGMLRATATAGQPIALGYLVAVGLGLYLFLQQSIKQRYIRWLGTVLLTAGLIASLSRGPWLGAAVLLIIYFASGPNAIPRLAGMALVSVLAFSLIAMLPIGERVVNLLPFIGKTEAGSIEGRQTLLEVSIRVIERHPWLGSVDYLEAPELQSMRTGLGIIDIVNSYLQIALGTGLVGLGLFVGFFAMTLFGIFRAMRFVRKKSSEERLLGRTLLATLSSILLIIFTVSSITIIPIVYWSVAGLSVAYAQMVRKLAREQSRTPVAKDQTTAAPRGAVTTRKLAGGTSRNTG